ncbi:hypothetical protein C8R43DRAFT_942588 [Mycena crocata]|nr:hypothetical protein C8R43DRAFT_942588 [Mycena crocata]
MFPHTAPLSRVSVLSLCLKINLHGNAVVPEPLTALWEHSGKRQLEMGTIVLSELLVQHGSTRPLMEAISGYLLRLTYGGCLRTFAKPSTQLEVIVWPKPSCLHVRNTEVLSMPPVPRQLEHGINFASISPQYRPLAPPAVHFNHLDLKYFNVTPSSHILQTRSIDILSIHLQLMLQNRWIVLDLWNSVLIAQVFDSRLVSIPFNSHLIQAVRMWSRFSLKDDFGGMRGPRVAFKSGLKEGYWKERQNYKAAFNPDLDYILDYLLTPPLLLGLTPNVCLHRFSLRIPLNVEYIFRFKAYLVQTTRRLKFEGWLFKGWDGIMGCIHLVLLYVYLFRPPWSLTRNAGPMLAWGSASGLSIRPSWRSRRRRSVSRNAVIILRPPQFPQTTDAQALQTRRLATLPSAQLDTEPGTANRVRGAKAAGFPPKRKRVRVGTWAHAPRNWSNGGGCSGLTGPGPGLAERNAGVEDAVGASRDRGGGGGRSDSHVRVVGDMAGGRERASGTWVDYGQGISRMRLRGALDGRNTLSQAPSRCKSDISSQRHSSEMRPLHIQKAAANDTRRECAYEVCAALGGEMTEGWRDEMDKSWVTRT